MQKKVFDDADGLRLPNLSMYKWVNEYLYAIVEMLRDPQQRAEMSKPDVVCNSTEFHKELSDVKMVTKLYQDMTTKLQMAMDFFH